MILLVKKMSELIWEDGQLVNYKFYNPNAKPNATIEEINGKKYVWVNGELLPVKNLTKY